MQRVKSPEPTFISGKTKFRISWNIRFLLSGIAVTVNFLSHGGVDIHHNFFICFTAHESHTIHFMKNKEVYGLAHG